MRQRPEEKMPWEETLAGLITSELRGTKEQREWAVAAIAEHGAELMDGFCRALREEVPSARAAAAEALGCTGEPRAIGPLLETLHDPQEWVRWTAAMALGKLGGAAVAGLEQALQEADPRVRFLAAQALGQTGEPGAIAPLRKALEDVFWGVRQAAVEALVQLGAVQALPDLCRALEDTHVQVRWAAAKALGRIGGVEALEPLGRATADQDFSFRWAAIHALRSLLGRLIQHPQREALVPLQRLDRSGLSRDLRQEVRQALRRLEAWLQETEGHIPAGALSRSTGREESAPGPASLSRIPTGERPS